MSYILDSLRRVEQEQKRGKQPDLSLLDRRSDFPDRRHRLWIWIAVLLLLNAALLAVLLWPDSQPEEQRKPPEQSRRVTGPERLPTITEPEPAIGHTPTWSTSASRSATRPLALEAGSALNDPASPPAGGPIPSEKFQGPPKSVPPAHLETNGTPAPASVPRTDAIGTDAPEATSSGPQGQPSPRPAAAKTARPPDADPKTAPAKAPSDGIASLGELAPALRERIEALEINVHMYYSDPSQSVVYINMQPYRPGDPIGDSGLRLKEITPEGVVLGTGQGWVRVPKSK